jgi:hypothetical protein
LENPIGIKVKFFHLPIDLTPTLIYTNGENGSAEVWTKYMFVEELFAGDARNFSILELAAVRCVLNEIALNLYGDPSVGIYTARPR